MQAHTFRKLSILIVFSIVAVFSINSTVMGKGRKAPRAKTVTGSGCIETGVEAGCLILTDKKTGTVYNLYFRGHKKPKAGTAIRFSGTEHSGPTTCMQGQAVNVKTWVILKMKCLPKKPQ